MEMMISLYRPREKLENCTEGPSVIEISKTRETKESTDVASSRLSVFEYAGAKTMFDFFPPPPQYPHYHTPKSRTCVGGGANNMRPLSSVGGTK